MLWCQNNLEHRFIFCVSKTHRRSPITPTPPNNRFVTVSLPPYFVLSRQCAIILALVRHLVIVIVLSCHFLIDSKVDYTTVNYVDLSKIYIFDGFTWSAWSDYNHFFKLTCSTTFGSGTGVFVWSMVRAHQFFSIPLNHNYVEKTPLLILIQQKQQFIKVQECYMISCKISLLMGSSLK